MDHRRDVRELRTANSSIPLRYWMSHERLWISCRQDKPSKSEKLFDNPDAAIDQVNGRTREATSQPVRGGGGVPPTVGGRPSQTT